LFLALRLFPAARPQVTVSVTVALCVNVPDVPVIVIVYVPAGVPVTGSPLQLVSEIAIRAAKVHASFLTVVVRRVHHARHTRPNSERPSVAVLMPDVGRGAIRSEIAGAVRAVVVIVAAAVAPAGVGVTEVGLSVHVEPPGVPEQVRATESVKLFRPTTVTVTFADDPAATLAVVGETAMVKSALVVVPTPARAAVCGLLESLSATLNVAVTMPVAVGVNVTLIGQLAPTASVAPHVFVWANDEADVPVMLTTMLLTVALLLFFSVTVCAALVVPIP
jgi:hypothetical protein